MFSKNKIDRSLVSSNPAVRSLSILSGSAAVKGEINIEDDLRIDGNVDGDIHSGGKVVVGPEGCVKGTITGKSVEVTGKIFGDVTVSDIVILRASCYYEGQITARNIEIEAGASFFGNCKMQGEGKKEISGNDISTDNEIISTIPTAIGKEKQKEIMEKT